MIGTAASGPGEALVTGTAPALHRTGVLLTGDADLALDLVVQALDRAGRSATAGGAGLLDGLRAEVVRAYLRSAPRRAEGALVGPDPYDVLRSLRPRARAATVLRLGHGWEAGATARVVGVSARRVSTLVPGTPGLDRVLESVGDRHHLPAAEVVARVRDRRDPAQTGRTARAGRRGLRGLAGLGLVLALALGYAVNQPAGGPAEDPALAGTGGQSPDLTTFGWHLDGSGRPPAVVMGLQRQTVVEIDYAEPSQQVSWDAGHLLPGGLAGHAVLWCDMPPADPNIEPPSGTLTHDGESIELPCAGRDGDPPVGQVVPVPVRGPARVELSGDLPRGGSATLAVYREGALSRAVPLAGGQPRRIVPEVPRDAVVVDTVVTQADWLGSTRLVGSMEVSAQTELRVLAGQTGTVRVLVDGITVTDDGDLAARALGEEAAGVGDWRTQQVDLRDGRWMVYRPGAARDFPLPEELRPAPGRTRTVTVEVLTEGMADDVQVVARASGDAPRDTPVAARLPLGAAELAGVADPAQGFRLAGAWTVRQDGLGHDLEGDVPPGAHLIAFLPTAPEQGWDPQDPWGTARRGGQVLPLILEPGAPALERWLRRLSQTPPAETGPVGGGEAPAEGPTRVWVPAAPGHPPAVVLALEQVAFEDFDLRGAPAPPGSSPSSGPRPRTTGESLAPAAVVTEQDLAPDASATVPLPPRSAPTRLRITTVGIGRIRILEAGAPLHLPQVRDGWWSSWTDEAVTSELTTSQGRRGDRTLTLQVEGYPEGFTVEVFSES